ncbi:hypothetical protein HF521_017273 [Silurus meridionalis]|uniref:LRAT domain-containing protein n=1 Tax=Silurus meridionalis TaxID=175797 RepID=A0A8T0BS27_SILME|nr:hypothetical protein HF521_017273 [Silurus meridionalis]
MVQAPLKLYGQYLRLGIEEHGQSTIRIGFGNTPEGFKVIKQEDQELKEQLKIGDLILVPRHSQCMVSATGYYHAGVYFSDVDQNIIHFTQQHTSSRSPSGIGGVLTEQINVFCEGDRYIVFLKVAGIPHDFLERVSAALRRNPKYDLLKYNCIHFTLELLEVEPEEGNSMKHYNEKITRLGSALDVYLKGLKSSNRRIRS